MGQPVVLYGSTPSTVAAGRIAQLSDELALRNFTDKLLCIKELRFNLQNSTPTERWVPTAQVELRIGNEPITNGLVPLGAMTWPIDVGTVTDQPVQSYPARCAFAKPVYLSPGERIHASIKIPASYGESVTAFRPHLTAICRVEDANVDPRRGFLPWFTGYTAVLRTAVGIYTEQSDPSVFQNNFPTTLLVDRFIGNWTLDPLRTQTVGAVSGSATLNDYAFGAKLIRVRCEDHLGNQVVRDPTPFGVIFDQTRRYWRAKTTLASRGFFRFTFESDLRGLTLPTGSNSFPAPILGMLGFRPSSGR